MELKFKNALIYAAINGIIYFVIPIILINIIQNQNWLDFSTSFILFIMIFGIIHLIIAFIQHIFPTNSLNFNLIGLGAAIISGIYLFYMFGGFSSGETFGNYRVETVDLTANLGLQIFAWALLIASIFNIMHYLVKCIEIRKLKENILKFKSIKIKTLLRSVSFIAYIVIGVYIVSIAFSGLGLGFQTKDNYDINWDNNSTLFIYDDDRIVITTYFDIHNDGLYSIRNVYIDAEIYTVNTSDITQLVLPDNTKIGEIKNIHYEIFPGQSTTYNAQFNIDILPQYVLGLIFNDANLEIRVSLVCFYAGIDLDVNTTIQTYWTSLL